MHATDAFDSASEGFYERCSFEFRELLACCVLFQVPHDDDTVVFHLKVQAHESARAFNGSRRSGKGLSV